MVDSVNNANNVAVAGLKRPKGMQLDIKDSEVKASLEKAVPIKKRLAQGSLGTRYGLDEVQSITIPKRFKDQVELAKTMYDEEGIVKTVIDLMVDFSATKMRNVTTQSKSQKFFDNLCKYSDMDSMLRWVFKEYYLSGDVFTYRGEKQLVPSGTDKGTIFYPYTVLNPTVVEVEGSNMFNYSVYTMQLTDEIRRLISAIKRKEKYVAQILKYVPKEFKNTESIDHYGRILLDPRKVARISRNRQPYEERPSPFISGAFGPLVLKRRLREMDLATAEGTINSIMVIKVGNDIYPATPPQLEALAALFSTGSKSYQLFWNHTLEIEIVSSDLTALGEEKYKQINMDILASLGMPSVLINGGDESGRFANAWASIVALIERLENGRRQISRWLEEEYRKIAEENGIKEVPKVEFERMNLREEKVFKAILTQYYDRGLLDVETMLEDSGYDYEQIKNRKVEEKKDKDVFAPPYAAKAPSAPKPPPVPNPNDGGEGRPRNEISPKYEGRPPQDGPKMKGYPPD